jgi:EAL domain-containing protein (putative c-di-GMP-specific phosphodiesterase class I)
VNPADAAITTATISMAKSLNLKVIAEGLKTRRDCHFSEDINVMKFKATTLSPPLAVDDATDKLRAVYSEELRPNRTEACWVGS